MRKTFILAAALVLTNLAEVSIALPLRLDFRKNPNGNSNSVEVRCDNSTVELESGEIARVANAIDILYTGDSLHIADGSQLTDAVEFHSLDLPLFFNSFQSRKCGAIAPDLTFLGRNSIDNFSAKISNHSNGKLDISGLLQTQQSYVSGMVVVNGTLQMEGGGLLTLDDLAPNSSLRINGSLVSHQQLLIDVNSPNAKIINRGTVRAPNIGLSADQLINEDSGTIKGEMAVLRVGMKAENSGCIEIGHKMKFSLPQYLMNRALKNNPIHFVQAGTLVVREDAILNCNLDSYGNTSIGRALFPTNSSLKISGGRTDIGALYGNLWLIQKSEEAEGKIGKAKITNDSNLNQKLFVKSDQSALEIESLKSNVEAIFSTDSGGLISVNKLKTPGNTAYSSSGTMHFNKMKGKTTAFIGEGAKFIANDAEEIENLMLKDQSQAKISNSSVKQSYVLDNSKGKFNNSEVANLTNQGTSKINGSRLKNANNEGTIAFSGDTTTDSLNNEKKAIFKSGSHVVKKVNGGLRSKVQLQGNPAVEHSALRHNYLRSLMDASQQHREVAAVENPSTLLQGENTTVTIGELEGAGTIEAPEQFYEKKFPMGYDLKGNVAAYMERMPAPFEIPLHQSDHFNVFVNMHNDFINRQNIDYDDVTLIMNMNGCKWENIGATFAAGGLVVGNASTFGNSDGLIAARHGMLVHANEKIFNIAKPIARDNGRWVVDNSNWRATLTYYCPATYYSTNPDAGIIVPAGDLVMLCGGDIDVTFSNIWTGGNLQVVAKGTFKNSVGKIRAMGVGQSIIEALAIVNACLPAAVRKGEAHAKGRCGWGFGRHTWYADSYTYELVTQSHGSEMLFGGDIDFRGHTDNIGSSIISRGLCNGDINSKGLLTNTAWHGSAGSRLEGDYAIISDASVWIHEDRIALVTRAQDEE